MMKTAFRLTLLTFLMAGMTGCDPLQLDEVIDPNNPTVIGVLKDASKGELQNLVAGLEARHRSTIAGVIPAFGSFGRELWLIQTDPRSITDLLGQGGLTPYPDHFGTGSTYGTPYAAIKQANILMESVANTTAVTETEAHAYIGFAKTIQGLQYLFPLNAQYQNGIRIDVKEPLNPGPILGYTEALQAIRDILDDAADELRASGTSLPFDLTAGFDGFDTPQGLLQFNRAVAARAAIYAKDWQGALDALQESFFNLNGDLNVGPRVVFGAPPDDYNPLYYPLGTGAVPLIGVHPSVIADAVPGDRRVAAKFGEREQPFANPRLNVAVTHQPILWAGQTAPVPVIRNEELVLIYAEAQAQLGNSTEAIRAVDVIRDAAGLQPYSGGTDTASLIDEILFERRYSLWGEGQRWIDLRRYDRLDEIPVDLDNGTVFVQLARPQSETSWEENKGS